MQEGLKEVISLAKRLDVSKSKASRGAAKKQETSFDHQVAEEGLAVQQGQVLVQSLCILLAGLKSGNANAEPRHQDDEIFGNY